jgi:hypothetical protein
MNEKIDELRKTYRKQEVEKFVLETSDDAIDFDEYSFSNLEEEQPPVIEDLKKINEKDRAVFADVGVLLDGSEERSGSYILYNTDQLIQESSIEGLECIPVAEALAKYDWVREKYWFKAVKEDTDKFTSKVGQLIPQGYFIRVKKGVKITKPFQCVFYTSVNNDVMSIHNIIVLEEDSELQLIAGCTNAHSVHKGLHLGITEAYVGKNAKLVSTMVHNWGSDMKIRPRSSTIVEEGGQY